jgi:hypothetical protein
MTSDSLRALLAQHGTAAVDILKDALADPLCPKKLKLDVARYIIDVVVAGSDSQTPNDNLAKIQALLSVKLPPTPPAAAPAPKRKRGAPKV